VRNLVGQNRTPAWGGDLGGRKHAVIDAMNTSHKQQRRTSGSRLRREQSCACCVGCGDSSCLGVGSWRARGTRTRHSRRDQFGWKQASQAIAFSYPIKSISGRLVRQRTAKERPIWSVADVPGQLPKTRARILALEEARLHQAGKVGSRA
jgi:hypothetical protein